MIRIKKSILIGLLGICSLAQAMEVKDLKCESLTTPSGITIARPHFSWTFIGDEQSPERATGLLILSVTMMFQEKFNSNSLNNLKYQ
jgi:galactosylceramidase